MPEKMRGDIKGYTRHLLTAALFNSGTVLSEVNQDSFTDIRSGINKREEFALFLETHDLFMRFLVWLKLKLNLKLKLS